MAVQFEQEANLTSAINSAIKSALVDVHTAMPGQIVSFDPMSQTASVQLAMRRITTAEAGSQELTLPLITKIPVMFPKAGGFSLRFPVQAGDECLVVFAERELTQWKNFGGVQTPKDYRRHHLTDGICILGLSSAKNALQNFSNTNCELSNENGDTKVSISNDTIVIEAKGKKIMLSESGIMIDGDLTVNGIISGTEVKVNTIELSQHVHVSANAGDNTSPPVP